jgi:alkylation response protein AidB-like acyl-CoA dehydrogenase
MDMTLSREDELFREVVRAYFEQEYPQAIISKLANGQTLSKADLVASEQALSAKGWLAPGWPREFGGPGWTITQRFIFDEELERAGAPNVVPMGLLYVAPVIYTFGTPEQRRRWLGDILASRTFWAQGYSEPGAGSDLASLRTRATRDGDAYIVDGEKTWTSDGHYADWIFCLVRTEDCPRKQDGITFLCIDMRTPGVEVVPIITIDGGHHLNRVIFNNVRAPVENRIGDEGKGWTYARHLLSHERTSYAHVAAKRRQIAELKRLAAAAPWGDALSKPGDGFRRRLAEVEIQLQALEMTCFAPSLPWPAARRLATKPRPSRSRRPKRRRPSRSCSSSWRGPTPPPSSRTAPQRTGAPVSRTSLASLRPRPQPISWPGPKPSMAARRRSKRTSSPGNLDSRDQLAAFGPGNRQSDSAMRRKPAASGRTSHRVS